MRKAFSFYRSHYEQMKLLNNKQVSDITMAICEVQFLEVNIEDISFDDKMTQLVWTGIKHGLDTSVKGYVSKKGGIATPLARGSENVSTPLEQGEGEGEEKEEEKEQYVEGLNQKAFKMWCEHKGKAYTKRAKTISINLLIKHDEQTQLEMVEASIMNGWKGLFEPKQKSVSKSSNNAKDQVAAFFKKKNQGEFIDAEIN